MTTRSAMAHAHASGVKVQHKGAAAHARGKTVKAQADVGKMDGWTS